MSLGSALVELKVGFNQAQAWLAPVQTGMIVYLFLAAAYETVGFRPYWLYILTGYLALGVPAIGLMILNRRYLVPREYALYGSMMGVSGTPTSQAEQPQEADESPERPHPQYRERVEDFIPEYP